jgi:hypothetical protein
LDFGTSATKVVVRIDEGPAPPRFLIVGPSRAVSTVLFPSSVAIEGGDLLFGAFAENSAAPTKARSFKMNLPAEAESRQHGWRGRLEFGPSALSAEEVSTLYLAWVLNDVLTQVGSALNGADLKVTVNAAAPLDQMEQEVNLRELFHRIVFRALKISHLATDRWPLAEARGVVADICRVPLPPDEESPVTILPETHAAMTSYMLQPGRPRGNYASVDVGAGSTDVAFFWFHATDGRPEMCYYGAASDFVGMDDMDLVIATASGTSPASARKSRETGRVNLSLFSTSLAPVLESIYKCYRRGFGRSYDRCRGESEWCHPDGRAKYTLCLVGGGSLCDTLVSRLNRPLPLLYMASVNVEVLRVPDDLDVLQPSGYHRIQQIAPGEQSLLLLSHGLAHRAVDIPAYEVGQIFERVREVADRPAHEELYAR